MWVSFDFQDGIFHLPELWSNSIFSFNCQRANSPCGILCRLTGVENTQLRISCIKVRIFDNPVSRPVHKPTELLPIAAVNKKA